MTITKKRQLNGHYAIFADGKLVGEVWRYPKGMFGLRLNGFFWKNGVANTNGGMSTISAKTQRECIAIAEQTLR